MTQKFDPNASYCVTAGNVRVQGAVNKTFSSASVDEKGKKQTFKLSHLDEPAIAFLVMERRCIMLHSEWLKTNEGKAGGK